MASSSSGKRSEDNTVCQTEGQRDRKEENKILVMPESLSNGPYPGNVVKYRVVEIKASLDMSKNIFKWKSTPLECRAYERLLNLYEEGYKMLQYKALPTGKFVTLTYDEDSSTQLQVRKHAKFQGLFRRLFPEESGQRWQLKIQNCLLFNQVSYDCHGGIFSKSEAHFNRVSDRQQIMETINKISQTHGRLISVTMVDFAGQELEIEQYKAWATRHTCKGELRKTQVGVDIFYEVPLHSSPESYIYQAVDCPVQASMGVSGFSSEGWKCSFSNWRPIMDQYLGTGWKLVEIFPDNAIQQTSTLSGLTVRSSLTQNFVWVFEKPKSREHDSTSYYEGSMMEYWFEVDGQKGYKGPFEQLDSRWEAAVTEMGQHGWEIVGMVETPERKTKGGFFEKFIIWTKTWVFFQRLIPPPAYSEIF